MAEGSANSLLVRSPGGGMGSLVNGRVPVVTVIVR
jgi:hypothetical protein